VLDHLSLCFASVECSYVVECELSWFTVTRWNHVIEKVKPVWVVHSLRVLCVRSQFQYRLVYWLFWSIFLVFFSPSLSRLREGVERGQLLPPSYYLIAIQFKFEIQFSTRWCLCMKEFFFFHWHYSPLWALACRTMSLHFFLSATNSLHLLTPSTPDFFLLPLSIFSWVFPFFSTLPGLEWRSFWASYPPPFSPDDLTNLTFVLLFILLYFLLCSSLLVMWKNCITLSGTQQLEHSALKQQIDKPVLNYKEIYQIISSLTFCRRNYFLSFSTFCI